MSEENLRQFCRHVLDDPALQDKLKNITDREGFVACMVELGSKAGFEISREEIERQMRENRRLWHERWI